MRFEITAIEESEGLVRGLVRSGGRDLRGIAQTFMSAPSTCPYSGGSGNMCPVESWVAKSNGEVPGGDAGDWGLVFRVRDPVLLSQLKDGTRAIEINKEINITKVIKSMTPNATERIDELANGLIAKSNNSMDICAARIQIRKEHPDLARQESEEYRTDQSVRAAGRAGDDDSEDEEEIERLALLLMEGTSLDIAEARAKIREQRTIAKAASRFV